jgi:GNAT superfamily N-acetyltransferase
MSHPATMSQPPGAPAPAGTPDRSPVGTLRVATADDAGAIQALMQASIRALFPAFYDERQTASSVVHVGHVDRMLIDDGTYLVIEDDGELIACGGWSRRDRLYMGSGEAAGDVRILDPATEPARVRAMFVRGDRTRRGLGTRILAACEAAARAEGYQTLALMATLPGVPLYESFGFVVTERSDVILADGVPLACAAMTKPVAPVIPG